MPPRLFRRRTRLVIVTIGTGLINGYSQAGVTLRHREFRWLCMQFVAPGSRSAPDSSVDACWDYNADDWREDVVDAVCELKLNTVRFGRFSALPQVARRSVCGQAAADAQLCLRLAVDRNAPRREKSIRASPPNSCAVLIGATRYLRVRGECSEARPLAKASASKSSAKRPLAKKLIDLHRIDGGEKIGAPLALRIDQTLTQDATGTLAMLSLEAMRLDRVKTEVSVQYVDHNLLQVDNLNAEDHIFLESACRRFGLWYSRPGNGISHVVHMERFGQPGKSLLGSDSHTPAAGSLGMLAIGAGGLDVALAMAGEPYLTETPEIFGVELNGALPPWVSAKDVILEMLRRHGVAGGVGKIIEYYGSGLRGLTAMDRHVIANMGAELGATTSVFPSDEATREFMAARGREAQWRALAADEGCEYDIHDSINLSALEPLIALPSSPGKVVPVTEVEGREIGQAYIGSSANPGWRDFAICAEMVRGKTIPPAVSLDVNPTSREMLQMLLDDRRLAALLSAGARIHQTGCNGCIGMGQAPAIGRNSLRTTPRNFPGRSGTKRFGLSLLARDRDRLGACGPYR